MSNPVFQGNHHKGYKGHGVEGTGVQNVTVQMGWGSISGHAGDVCYVQLSSMVTGDINQGVFFQSECEVTVDYTLCNPGMAISFDPEDQAMVMWDGAQAIAVGKMTQASFSLFTVMRVTFVGDGTFYAGVR